MNKFTMGIVGVSLAVAVPLGFVVLATWWMEDRFGSGVAVMVWGGTLGLVAFGLGALLSARISKATLESVADFMDANAQTEKGRALYHCHTSNRGQTSGLYCGNCTSERVAKIRHWPRRMSWAKRQKVWVG